MRVEKAPEWLSEAFFFARFRRDYYPFARLVFQAFLAARLRFSAKARARRVATALFAIEVSSAADLLDMT
jgi:hypothetical protein